MASRIASKSPLGTQGCPRAVLYASEVPWTPSRGRKRPHLAPKVLQKVSFWQQKSFIFNPSNAILYLQSLSTSTSSSHPHLSLWNDFNICIYDLIMTHDIWPLAFGLWPLVCGLAFGLVSASASAGRAKRFQFLKT